MWFRPYCKLQNNGALPAGREADGLVETQVTCRKPSAFLRVGYWRSAIGRLQKGLGERAQRVRCIN